MRESSIGADGGRRASPVSLRVSLQYSLALLLAGAAAGGAAALSPLYRIYSEEWDLSPLLVTPVFGGYAIGALVGSTYIGPLADRGRKPLLIGGVLGLAVSFTTMAFASQVEVLILARLAQGVSASSVVVAASCMLQDLRPGQENKAGLNTGVAFHVGLAGTFGGVTLAIRAAEDPFRTSFVWLLSVVAVAGLLVACVSETLDRSAASVPRTAPRRFVAARLSRSLRPGVRRSSLSLAMSWMMVGFVLSLFPKAVGELSPGTSAFEIDAAVVLMLLVAAAVQFQPTRWPVRIMGLLACVAASVAVVLLLALLSSSAAAWIWIVSPMLGASIGLTFGAALRNAAELAGPTEKGQVMSALYLRGYLALAGLTVMFGAISTYWSLRTGLIMFCALLLGLTLLSFRAWLLSEGRADA